MTTIADPSWAIQQLDSFIALTGLVPLASGRPGRQHRGSKDELTAQAAVVERIFLCAASSRRRLRASSVASRRAGAG
ncbi:hypothetical protein AB0D59_50910 [Streptomyces sp. NPDC048417]|uniref:hypothetical protein n=1 Tax=Streptomyces sp. NPDC048417 TaxID=3155387 RepID=UPI00343ED0C1